MHGGAGSACLLTTVADPTINQSVVFCHSREQRTERTRVCLPRVSEGGVFCCERYSEYQLDNALCLMASVLSDRMCGLKVKDDYRSQGFS